MTPRTEPERVLDGLIWFALAIGALASLALLAGLLWALSAMPPWMVLVPAAGTAWIGVAWWRNRGHGRAVGVRREP